MEVMYVPLDVLMACSCYSLSNLWKKLMDLKVKLLK